VNAAPTCNVRPQVADSPEDLPDAGPLLGIDPGRKTLGVAISDPERRVAIPLPEIRRGSLRALTAQLRPLVASRSVAALVVGLPRHLSGAEGRSAQSARALACNLSRELELPAALWDERLSTAAAERPTPIARKRRGRTARPMDSVAASFILQGALNRLRILQESRS